jgi:hypothetical protein
MTASAESGHRSYLGAGTGTGANVRFRPEAVVKPVSRDPEMGATRPT